MHTLSIHIKKRKNLLKKIQAVGKNLEYIPLFFVIILFIGIFLGFCSINYLQQRKNHQLNSPSYPTPQPTPTITVLDASKYHVDTATWKTYYDNTFDFSIKYPPDWKVYTGDEKQGYNSSTGDGFSCPELIGFLKDPTSCNQDIANHFLNIVGPNHFQDGIGSEIAMYIHANGGGEGLENTKLPLEINRHTYLLTMAYLKANSSQNSLSEGSYVGSLYHSISLTGPKSIWETMNLHLDVFESDLPTVVYILESIKN